MKHWLYKSGWRLFPGLLAVGVTLLSARMEVFQPLESHAYHTLFKIRGEQPWDDRVVAIEIDDASLDAIGQFPWPRHYYTDLLEQITPATPNVIAFDILFDEPSADDEALAAAMAQHGNVVLATAWDSQHGVIGPNASVVEGAIATGHIHSHADADGITRVYKPKLNGTMALSLAAIQRYSLQSTDVPKNHEPGQTLWLNWRGASQKAPRYSFVDVLMGQVPAETFSNKIVFIGFTGTQLDLMTTPYNQNPPAAGVYQHIVAANNILAQDHLQPVILPMWGLLVLFSPMLGGLLLYRCSRTQILVCLLLISMWGGAVIVAFSYNYWLPTGVPIINIVATGMLAKLAEQLQLRLKRLQLANNEMVSMPLRLRNYSYTHCILATTTSHRSRSQDISL